MSPASRAINLARVSTPRQAELYSLDYQLEQMRAYDAEVGLMVVAEFKDDVSGRKLDRDGLEEACQMLERNEADVLVTWKFDRLHRNYVNSVLLRERIRKAGKEIHYAQSRTVSGKTARQRLPEDLQYIMAEIDADDIVERNQTGMRNKAAKAGKWLGLNRPPFGYVKRGQGKTAEMVIDDWDGLKDEKDGPAFVHAIQGGEIPAEVLPLLQAGSAQAVVVRLIYTWYVYGDGEGKPISALAIVNRLTALKIPPPEAHLTKRHHLKVRAIDEWNRAYIYKLLRQTAYSGVIYHFRWKKVGTSVIANPNKNEWIPVSVPQIVDTAIWNEAQKKLDTGRQFSRRASVNKYLVGRRIRCECGYKMRGTPMHHSYTRLDGHTTHYEYSKYMCPGVTSKRIGDVSRTCDMAKVRVSEVDDQVWTWIKEDIDSPEVLERKLHEIQEGQSAVHNDRRAILDTLYAHRTEIEDELSRLGTLYAKQGMPARIVDDLIAEHGHKLQLTEEEIRKLEGQLSTPLTDETIITLIQFSADFAAHLEAVESTFEGRRTVVDGLDVEVTIFRKDDGVYMKMKSLLRPDGLYARLFLTPSGS
jgi:DNA invertase Pin-like site-specific DNA recombinase